RRGRRAAGLQTEQGDVLGQPGNGLRVDRRTQLQGVLVADRQRACTTEDELHAVLGVVTVAAVEGRRAATGRPAAVRRAADRSTNSPAADIVEVVDARLEPPNPAAARG